MNSSRIAFLPTRLRNLCQTVPAFGELIYHSRFVIPCRGITNNASFQGLLQKQNKLNDGCILYFNSNINCCIPLSFSLASQARSYATKRVNKNSPTRYYDVLEISPKANQVQIKKAYFRLSKKYHPDVNKSKDASQRFSELSEAYEVLSKVTTRRMYDRGILDPQDPRSTHRSSHQWERPTTRGTSHQEAQGRAQTPPPSGRSPIYDYDEWLRTRFGQAGFNRFGMFSVGSKVEFQQSRNFWKSKDEDADSNLYHKEIFLSKGELLVVLVISGLAMACLFSITGIPRAPKTEYGENIAQQKDRK